ncbi:DUF3768 domain-containing protein [Agrobacterium pusense]|uniref:DUF3768 domain-containing protein n=1 Tax=Agrobacterium pusense TaxID=648995 RepID=UPI000D386482|nr:DUF3768 domain-containing protein [Agrobacterium pusense]PTV70208.1 hypothetical protein DBL06_25425 [Agrobacterium pusense]
MTDDERKIRIRDLNDELRTRGHARNGRVVVMGGLANEDNQKKVQVAIAAGQHTDWNSGDDPYGEHDFGRLDVEGEAFLFKIDYYSLDEAHASEHPEDQNTTIRVMTLMYAEDY